MANENIPDEDVSAQDEEVATEAESKPVEVSQDTHVELEIDQVPIVETPAKQSRISQFIKNTGHLHYLLAAAVLVIMVLGGLLIQSNNSSSDTDSAEAEVTTRATDADDEDELLTDDEIHSEAGNDEIVEVVAGESIVIGAVSWEKSPVLVETQALFTTAAVDTFYELKEMENGYDIRRDGSIRTYRLGATTSQTVFLNYVLLSTGMADREATFFSIVDNTSGGITVTKWNAKNFVSETTDKLTVPAFADGIIISENGFIPELDYPESITYGGVTAERTSGWYTPEGTFGDDGITLLAVTDQIFEATKVDGATLYEVVRNLESADGIKTVELILQLPNGFRVQYRYITSLMSDDNSIPIKWSNDSSSTQDVYRWDLIWAGCGAVNQPLVLDKKYHKDLEVVGKSGEQDIFWLNSASHPTVKALFEASSASVGEGKITQEDFYNDRPAIVVRNELGFYLVLNNEKYQRAAECAKPVIYLYPEVPTFVEVKVGADVTKSDPYYGDGWSATAMPDGTLITSTGIYDSLFWDGYGHGAYPGITKGNFVSRANLEQRLVADMEHMGLNENEIVDFMEYWMPLMPDTDFVRLTWFNTAEMDELAPLELNFTPDSSIRVFLDFEGVDQPYDLTRQTLPSYERNGFTLVEWGGLRIAQ